MDANSYVKGLPNELREFYEEHYKGKQDSEALACRRLVCHEAMEEAYPLLVLHLKDANIKQVMPLPFWMQLAAIPLVAINDNLREKRKRGKELVEELRDCAIRFNEILTDAHSVPEFWPHRLNIGDLLDNAIDDRGSLVTLAPHWQEAPFLGTEEMKYGLRQLHVGDERYFPTLAEVMNQVASGASHALCSGEMETTGYPNIDVGLTSRKDNDIASYLRMFCANWDEAAQFGNMPKARPPHKVLRAQAVAALELPITEADRLTEQRVAQYLHDFEKLKGGKAKQ